MGWIDRSLPPEADDPLQAPPSELEQLVAERQQLLGRVRRGIRSRHQERILRRIAEITRKILQQRTSGAQ